MKSWGARGLKRVGCRRGDGTVSAVATDVIRSGFRHLAFAVLPLGTGNDLARSLRMPLIPEEAWPVCMAGVVPSNRSHACQFRRRRTFRNQHGDRRNTGRYTAVITDE